MLFYTNVKINIIKKKLIESANLAITQKLKLESVLQMSFSKFFCCFYRNIEFVVKELKVKYLVMLFEVGNNNFILSLSFLNFIEFGLKYTSK